MSNKAYLKSTVAALPLGVGLLGLSLTSALASGFPAIGGDTGPGEIITIDINGVASVASTGQGPFDGVEDTYIGVVNNSATPISSLNFSCNTGCFGFDNDGIDAYGQTGNMLDSSGYGGPNAFFTNINSSANTGTVNFITPIAITNGTSYFSLEEALNSASFTSISVNSTPLPSTWTMLLLGLVGVGFASYRTKTKQSSVAIA